LGLKTIIRHATDEDLMYVANNMRDQDLDEIYAGGETPERALRMSAEISKDCLSCVLESGEVLFVLGCGPKTLLSDIGVPWLLGSKEALKHPRSFFDFPPKVLEIWKEQYSMLENYVHVKNTVSVRWLQRLGFTMHEPVTLFTGEQFMRFSMEC
jgi:hypothetical protein